MWARDGSELTGARAVGQPLGLFPEPALDVQTRTLLPGDTLLLYTDGVTDTVNPAGDVFELDGLHAAVRAATATTAQELCDHIVERVVTFQETAQQHDDITLVVVQAY
ncbi:MAG: serine/threonine-protein phosphatase [Herpetosiphonaceae bacterium]|nr:serine/threonine-protein phosphatase [Herpetosiphonaceae bacterium]